MYKRQVYGQLVQILAPYTRVIKDEPKEGADAADAADAAGSGSGAATDAAPDATQAFVQAAASGDAPARKPALRIRKADVAKDDDAPM